MLLFLGLIEMNILILKYYQQMEINFLEEKTFDNKLTEYILDDFCRKYNESKEKIKQDKKVIRKLKIYCEIIKKKFKH